MTPEKLDKWAAEEVMGFKRVLSPDCNKYPLPYVEDSNGNRFSFRPSTDANQVFMVVAAMRKTSFPCFKLTCDICGNYIAEFSNFVANKKIAMNTNPNLAILTAAHAALKEVHP